MIVNGVYWSSHKVRATCCRWKQCKLYPSTCQITEPGEGGGPHTARRCHEQIVARAVAGKKSALKLLDRNVTHSVLVDESMLGTESAEVSQDAKVLYSFFVKQDEEI